MSDEGNNSTRKLDIEFFTKANGSRWIQVVLLKYNVRPRWIPSLRDLHRILQALAVCEDEKYPFPAKGRHRLVDFLRDAVLNPDYEALAVKYKIPEYDRDKLVKTNGAALTQPVAAGGLPLFIDERADAYAAATSCPVCQRESCEGHRVARDLTDDDISWG